MRRDSSLAERGFGGLRILGERVAAALYQMRRMEISGAACIGDFLSAAMVGVLGICIVRSGPIILCNVERKIFGGISS